jgi:hypothetical protein
MQGLREETIESNCGVASAVLVAELLEVPYSEADLAELRPRGGSLSFASLSAWFVARGLHACGVEADAESISTLGGVCILQVVGDSVVANEGPMHFLVAVPQGAGLAPVILDPTLPLEEQSSLDPATTLLRWTGRALVVSRDPGACDPHSGGDVASILRWGGVCMVAAVGAACGFYVRRRARIER